MLNKLTDRLSKQTTRGRIGTYYTPPTQPIITLHITNYITQPLIITKISTTSEIRVFLRYRSIKANLALKSPEIRRTLKPVATASLFIVFSVNPHSHSNCRTCRTSPPLTFKANPNGSSITNTNYAE